MKKIKILLGCLFFMTFLANGQDNYILQWSDTQFIGTGGIAFNDAKVLAGGNGGVYMCGSSYNVFFDIICIKYDTDGEIVWQYTYDGYYLNEIMKDAKFDSQGNILMLCTSEIEHSQNRVLLIKLSPDGEVLMEREYFMNEASIQSGNMILDESDNIYISGGAAENVNGTWTGRGFCAKFDTEGELLWDRTFYSGAGQAINLNQDTVSVLGLVGGFGQYYLMKYNRFTGELIDSIIHPYNDLIVFPFFHPGSKGSFYIGKYDDGYRVEKVNNQGDICWTYEKLPSSPDSPKGSLHHIVEDDSSNIYCAGVYFRECCYATTVLTKLNHQGEKIFETAHPFESNYGVGPNNILITDSNIYITGTGIEEGSEIQERAVLKYSLSGEEKAAFTYLNPLGDSDFGLSTAVDTSGNLFALGYSYYAENVTFSTTVLKYSLEPNGVKEPPALTDMHIFPNPVKGHVVLAFESLVSGEAIVNIRDVLGTLIKSIPVSLHSGNNQLSIPADNLPKGVLYISVEANGHVFTSKMVKVE